MPTGQRDGLRATALFFEVESESSPLCLWSLPHGLWEAGQGRAGRGGAGARSIRGTLSPLGLPPLLSRSASAVGG